MPNFNRWLIYAKVRFPVIPLLIFTQLICLSAEKYLVGSFSPNGYLSGAIFLLFFLYIRLLDEFKDYQYDSTYHKDRPVQSGLIHLKEIQVLVWLVVASITYLALQLRFQIALIVVFLYSLLTFKEFFVRDFYHRFSVLYLVSHELIFIPLYVFFFSNITGYWYLPLSLKDTALFVFCLIPVTLVEIGRKMQHRWDTSGNKTSDTYAYMWGESETIRVFMILVALAFLVLYFLTGSIVLVPSIFVSVLLACMANNQMLKQYIMLHNMLITISISLILPILLLVI